MHRNLSWVWWTYSWSRLQERDAPCTTVARLGTSAKFVHKSNLALTPDKTWMSLKQSDHHDLPLIQLSELSGKSIVPALTVNMHASTCNAFEILTQEQIYVQQGLNLFKRSVSAWTTWPSRVSPLKRSIAPS